MSTTVPLLWQRRGFGPLEVQIFCENNKGLEFSPWEARVFCMKYGLEPNETGVFCTKNMGLAVAT